MWYVYILKSEKSGLLYTGMTENIQTRLTQHNSGKSKFTKGHIPWTLVYSEEIGSTAEARKREKFFKSTHGKRFLKTKGIKTGL